MDLRLRTGERVSVQDVAVANWGPRRLSCVSAGIDLFWDRRRRHRGRLSPLLNEARSLVPLVLSHSVFLVELPKRHDLILS